jgi:hypothetical protein
MPVVTNDFIPLNLLDVNLKTKKFCVMLFCELFVLFGTAVCLPGCHVENGYCDLPNECKYVHLKICMNTAFDFL